MRPIVFYFCNIGRKEIMNTSTDGMDCVMPTEIALVSGNISLLLVKADYSIFVLFNMSF